MKYDEIIGLNDYFQPVYDLENEVGTYWKQFIPNEKFYKILSETINSLESNEPKERKSIWLQGSYGTGKSHATAVIKHLLYDNIENIIDYIENLENTQLKFRLKKFRERKKVFPVVLKGISSIVDNRTFALAIERAVKIELKKMGINISTKSDFERLIYHIEKNPINIVWEENIKSSQKLKNYVRSKEELIDKLKNWDIEVLTTVDDEIFSKNGVHLSYSDISQWLVEVANELKEKEIADALMIYWDEFTGILELPKSNLILAELQNIAERSINEDVYLFVIVHKRRINYPATQEEIDKVLDRFKVIDYSMEPITTYHIINQVIKKKDKDKFDKLKMKYIPSVKPLIEKIAGNEGTQVKKYLENIFPIHPYTAYLATFIARNIGSTERSIFKFLFDENSGFKKFIKENPNNKGKIFLTAEYLWDFFYNEFENIENEKVRTVLDTFKSRKDTLKEKGDEYLSVLKGILLLNLLYRFVTMEDSSLVSPSEKNIMNLFAGVIGENNLNIILSFIDNNQIINKTPDNLYLITAIGLPSREVDIEKKKIKNEYNTIDRILSDNQKKELQATISASVNRELEFTIMDASLSVNLIRRKVEKVFKKDYTIHICLFLGKNYQELQQIKGILKRVSNDEELRNIIFVVSEVILDDKIFNRFIEYKARARVADKHNFSEVRNINEEYAEKIIDNWINEVKSGYIEWFVQNENGKGLMNELSRKINEELSRKIFYYGLENIEWIRKNKNVWKKQRSKSSIEIFLFANSRQEIEEKTSKGIQRNLREIIKDNNGEYIVDTNLKIKGNVTENHPLKKMYVEIRNAIEKEKNHGTFNLGDALKFLTKPPYGLYPNMVNMAAIGFLMREYVGVGKLFEARTGRQIQKEVMRNKIMDLFEYWEKGKYKEGLDVHFGTEDEEKLIEILKDLFKLEDVESLNEARWKVREWVKKREFPIYVFKFAENINENTKKAIDAIFDLIQSVDSELTYEKIRDYLHTIEGVKDDLDILIDRESPKELFKKWLKNIEGVEIPSEDLEEVIDYVKRNMQEEVASWTEDRIREKVKDWYTEKLKKSQELLEKQLEELKSSKQDEEITTFKHDEIYSLSRYEEKVKNIKQQIENYSAEKLKTILIRLIDDLKDRHPEIIEVIEKYMEVN